MTTPRRSARLAALHGRPPPPTTEDECDVCYKHLISPVQMCHNGHVVCLECAASIWYATENVVRMVWRADDRAMYVLTRGDVKCPFCRALSHPDTIFNVCVPVPTAHPPTTKCPKCPFTSEARLALLRHVGLRCHRDATFL